jgi:hypothetical protein
LVFEGVPGKHMELEREDLERSFGKYFGPEREDWVVDGGDDEGRQQVLGGHQGL